MKQSVAELREQKLNVPVFRFGEKSQWINLIKQISKELTELARDAKSLVKDAGNMKDEGEALDAGMGWEDLSQDIGDLAKKVKKVGGKIEDNFHDIADRLEESEDKGRGLAHGSQ